MSTAVFESWRGSYSDSPARISEAFGAAAPRLRRSWVADGATELPSDVRRLPRHSLSHVSTWVRAALFVSNEVVARRFLPTRNTIYVQTWHGTPLKLLGFDERVRAYDPSGDYLRQLRRDVRRWDFLVSPSPVCTDLFRSAFRYDGPVLEVGYPRNDPLFDDPVGSVRRKVRQALGADDRRVVLHVPTWRDDGHTVWEHQEMTRMLESLPEDTVLWLRSHKNDRLPAPHPRVVDVSSWPEINDLYLAADVLVSDYSSAVYDFAITRKPILLFVPDLDEYAKTRGFYSDYESWVPGPLARKAVDAIEFLRDPQLDLVTYERFLRTYCPYEDGCASRRVVEALMPALRNT